jgi:spoIIIJ-associated protein
MEWVETTGKTVEEAKEAALDQLGVDAQDAEFEVLDEPKTGLFGRLRGEARVRARVQPSRPRPKVDRRPPRKRREGGRRGGAEGDRDRPRPTTATATAGEPPEGGDDGGAEDAAGGGAARAGGAPRRRRRGGRGGTGGAGGSSRAPRAGQDDEEGNDMSDGNDDASVEDQAAITRTFLTGLLEAFDFDATIAEERLDDDTIELQVEGSDLGLLVGPKGQTLQAIQELSRTVIQRQATGTHHGRVRIDVAGYRQRRREALERFATQVAADVVASGTAKALEPMHPADRKVVHDTVNEIDGVRTTSEGEEPRRRVVILPVAHEAPGAPAPETPRED